ncbi:hypothetical protein [Brevibacillus sp. 179-C9.3 HS]|uniref:hypothetical protein n=1 Tax=unclassified Brevibacillus TaxID=2684853 RepID=UPI0039A257DF
MNRHDLNLRYRLVIEMEENQLEGTVRYYGCPAEEAGAKYVCPLPADLKPAARR